MSTFRMFENELSVIFFFEVLDFFCFFFYSVSRSDTRGVLLSAENE